MRRFYLPLFLFMLTFFLMVIAPMHPLYNHPAQSEQLVIPHGRTFEKVYLVHTPFERGACSTKDYRVPTVRSNRTVDDWTSPKEGRIVVSRGEGRWHRGQSARRSS